MPGLAARAGVVTGEVAVTLGAAGEGMVAGDAVNTASRVQGAAEPGAVLADAATQRLAGRAIGFADAGEHPLKGKAEPVQLWRATRVLSAVGGSQRVDGLEAPLTGRDAELRTVRDLFHAAADRRVSVENLAEALLMTGDWDADEAELAQALDADGLAGIEFLACCRAWLAALRGEVPAAQAILAGLGDLRASDDRQDHAVIALAEALAAPSGREPAAALRHARAALDHAAALGISHEYLRWAWPLAARAAHDLADAAATRELLALLDSCPAGRLAPCSGPNTTWPAPGSPPATAIRPPPWRSRSRSPGCASIPPSTILLTGCSITPGTCYAGTTTMPRGPRSVKPATSRSGQAAGSYWTGPLTFPPQSRRSGPRW